MEVLVSRVVYKQTCSQATVMAKLAHLFKLLFQTCSNGCIPNVKMQHALKASHATEPIYYHNMNVDDWVGDASCAIRQVARHYRMAKESQEQQETTLKKALGMNLL